MEKANIVTNILVCDYNELDAGQKKLVDAAKDAVTRAYAPYSHFSVGAAALLDGGVVVTGNNQENAAFPSGICAERTTLFYAGAQYPRCAVRKLAIAAMKDGAYTPLPTAPCGACRQVILETENRYGSPVEILLYGVEKTYIIASVKDLLPLSFGKNDL